MREPQTPMHFEPNVTPFLDVLLVLLILFMFLIMDQQKAIMTQLPDPTIRDGDNTPAIVLEVRPNATYAINTQLVRGTELAARLRGIYEGRPTKTIIVRGAAGVTFQDVVTAVDIAKGAGIVAIGLAPGGRARPFEAR
jgi:biopolymer transport protein ExbD